MEQQRSSRPRAELQRQLELLSPTDRRVMAQLWHAPSPEPPALAAVMLDPARVAALWWQLNDGERAALTRILQDDGTLPVAVFQRLFGPVREPGGFEHPRAYLEALRGPATATERLYNLGLIFRSHDERGAIYRVPADLRALLPAVPPRERRLLVPVLDHFFDVRSEIDLDAWAVTLLMLAHAGSLKLNDDGSLNKASLAAVAKQLDAAVDLRAVRRESDWPAMAVLRAMLVKAGLLRRAPTNELRPSSQALAWLQSSHIQRAAALLDGWCISALDDLSVLCGLRWKGGAPYTLKRTATRRGLLQLLGTLPADGWLRLDDVVAAIHAVDPDFQRRDGRFDTWLLYDANDRLVSSWEDWELVEGALVRHVATGVLAWLGLVQVSADSAVIRLTPLGAHLLGAAPPPPEPATTPLIVQGTFEVLCPVDASPFARFQLARFAELKQNGPLAIYRLTRSALLAAAERGVEAPDALRFLEQHSNGVPPAVAYTLLDWGGQAEQVRLEDAVLLHAADPVVLAQLRNSRSLGLSDAEMLSSSSLRVPHAALPELADRMRRAGFGVRDERIDPQLPLDERDLRVLVTAAFAYARVCAELDQPCDVSPALLQRLGRLFPPRWIDAAQQQAAALAAIVAERPLPDADEA